MTLFLFFYYTATTDIYSYSHTLSRHDALPSCLGEAAAQRRALAHPPRVAQHGRVEVGDAAGGVVVGAVVDDDDVVAVRARVEHHLADPQRLVERRDDHGDVAAVPGYARAAGSRRLSHVRSPPAARGRARRGAGPTGRAPGRERVSPTG